MGTLPGPFTRTIWSVWNYITEAVDRLLRPEPVVLGTAAADSAEHGKGAADEAADAGLLEERGRAEVTTRPRCTVSWVQGSQGGPVLTDSPALHPHGEEEGLRGEGDPWTRQEGELDSCRSASGMVGWLDTLDGGNTVGEHTGEEDEEEDREHTGEEDEEEDREHTGEEDEEEDRADMDAVRKSSETDLDVLKEPGEDVLSDDEGLSFASEQKEEDEDTGSVTVSHCLQTPPVLLDVSNEKQELETGLDDAEGWSNDAVQEASDNRSPVSKDETTVVTGQQMTERRDSRDSLQTESLTDEDVARMKTWQEPRGTGGSEGREMESVGSVGVEKTLREEKTEEVRDDEIPALNAFCDQTRFLDMDQMIIEEDKMTERELICGGFRGAVTSSAADRVLEHNGVEIRELRDISPGRSQGSRVFLEAESAGCETREELPEYNNGRELDEDTTQKILEFGTDDERRTAQLREVNADSYGEEVEGVEAAVGGGCAALCPPAREEWEEEESGSHEKGCQAVIMEERSGTQSFSEEKSLRDKPDVPMNKTEIHAPEDTEEETHAEDTEEETHAEDTEEETHAEDTEEETHAEDTEEETHAEDTEEETHAEVKEEGEGKLVGETLQEEDGLEIEAVIDLWTSVFGETASSEREQAGDKSSEFKFELQWTTEAILADESEEAELLEEELAGTIRETAGRSNIGGAERPEAERLEAERPEAERLEAERPEAVIEGTLDSEQEEAGKMEEEDDGLSDKPSEDEPKLMEMDAGGYHDLMETEFRIPDEMTSSLVSEEREEGEPAGSLDEGERGVSDESEAEMAGWRTEVVEHEVKVKTTLPEVHDEGSFWKPKDAEPEEGVDPAERRFQENEDAHIAMVRGHSKAGEEMEVTVETEVTVEMEVRSRMVMQTKALAGVCEKDLTAVMTGVFEEEGVLCGSARSGSLEESSEDLMQNLIDSGLPDDPTDTTTGLSDEIQTDSENEPLEAETGGGLLEEPLETRTPDVIAETEEVRLSAKTVTRDSEVVRELKAGLFTEIKAACTSESATTEERSPEKLKERVVVERVEVRSTPGTADSVEERDERAGTQKNIPGVEKFSEVDGKERPSCLSSSSTYQDNQLGVSSLDFTAQKSRIYIKNRHVRPPKDPRTLLLKPSLAPSLGHSLAPSLAPSLGPSMAPKLSPSARVRVLPMGLGGIGIKLPGIGASPPVLRKTQMGDQESENRTQNKAEREEESVKQEETKPKWMPPRHPGFGNPLMMSELKNKLKKTQD